MRRDDSWRGETVRVVIVGVEGRASEPFGLAPAAVTVLRERFR